MTSLYSLTSCLALCIAALLTNALFSYVFKDNELRDDLKLWRNIVLGITAAAFLSPSIWIYFALLTTIILVSARKVVFPELFALTVFLIAYVEVRPLAELFEFHHARVIGLSMAYVVLTSSRRRHFASGPAIRYPSDPIFGLLLTYVLLTLLLAFAFGNATHTLRLGVVNTLDVLLPFLIMRRYVTTGVDAQRVFLALAFAFTYLGLIGIAEAISHRLFFPALQYSWGVDWSQFIWTTRGGALRAQSSGAQPIAFGYMMLMGIGAGLALKSFPPVRYRALPIVVMALGLLASVSRGPWLAGVAMAVMFAATAKQASRNIAYIVGGGTVAFLGLLMTPYGDRMIDVLPWVGTVEAHNITFREQLLAYAVAVVKQNPFTGLGFFAAPALEQFRTGEGIIDIVNTYAAIALSTGLTGLVPFILTFIVALSLGWKTMRRSAKSEPLRADSLRICCVLLVTTMIVIGTTASITVIPYLYYMLLGITAGLVRSLSLKKPVAVETLHPIVESPIRNVARRNVRLGQ